MPNEKVEKLVHSRREVAEAFGVVIKTVDVWIQKWNSEFPDHPNRQRSYNLRWIAEWNLVRQQVPEAVREASCRVLNRPYHKPPESAGNGNGNGGSSLELKQQLLAQQVRSETAKADTAERRNRIAEQSLVQLDDVRTFVSEWFTWMRVGLQRLPGEMKANIPAKHRDQIVAELDARLDLFLRSARDYGLRVEDIQSDDSAD